MIVLKLKEKVSRIITLFRDNLSIAYDFINCQYYFEHLFVILNLRKTNLIKQICLDVDSIHIDTFIK